MQHTQQPSTITSRSFEIIRRELRDAGYAYAPAEAAVVERIVHSTADFDFAEITRIGANAIEAGVAALRAGCAVVTDVNMIRVGISSRRVSALAGSLHCFVADPETRQRAEVAGTTRSAMGMRIAAERELVNGGIVVIGNAPTALFEVIRLAEEGVRPALIVGVPVGFVGAVESKQALTAVEAVPWITTEGRKGGSPVAVAIVNALLRLASGVPATDVD